MIEKMSSSEFCTPTTGKEEEDEHVARKKKKTKKRKTTTTPLDASARDFLHHLGLPSLHPLCDDATGGGAGGGHVASAAAHRDYDGIIEHRHLASRIVEGSIFELPHFVDDIASAAMTMTMTAAASSSSSVPSPPPPGVGPVPLLELHDHSAIEMLLTLATMTSATFAMMELWLRFFAIFLCPLCLCFSVHREMIAGGGGVVAAPTTTAKEEEEEEEEEKEKKKRRKTSSSSTVASAANATRLRCAVCVVGLASSAVILTDSLYVYEYGRYFGSSLFALSGVLAVRCPPPGAAASSSAFATWSVYRTATSVLIAATAIACLRSDRDYFFSASTVHHRANEAAAAADVVIALRKSSKNPLLHFSHPGIDLPTIDGGLYHSGASNPLIASVVSHWPERSRTYSRVGEDGDDDDDGATPYLVNGDMRTGIPFVLNGVEDQEYVRVWARNAYDGEHLALDVAFPYSPSPPSSDHRGSGSDDDDDAGETISFENDEERGRRRRRRRSIDGDDASGAQKMTFVHDIAKPVYLLLHGLNGGSHEQYM
jgi:hypothetical protein